MRIHTSTTSKPLLLDLCSDCKSTSRTNRREANIPQHQHPIAGPPVVPDVWVSHAHFLFAARRGDRFIDRDEVRDLFATEYDKPYQVRVPSPSATIATASSWTITRRWLAGFSMR